MCQFVFRVFFFLKNLFNMLFELRPTTRPGKCYDNLVMDGSSWTKVNKKYSYPSSFSTLAQTRWLPMSAEVVCHVTLVVNVLGRLGSLTIGDCFSPTGPSEVILSALIRGQMRIMQLNGSFLHLFWRFIKWWFEFNYHKHIAQPCQWYFSPYISKKRFDETIRKYIDADGKV